MARKLVLALILTLFACGKGPTSPSKETDAFPEGMLTFSFDDNRLCAYETAIPALDRAGFKSTNYVIVNALTNPNDYANRTQVISLESRGHEIGSHSVTHRDLLEISEGEWQREVAGSRQDLLSLGVRQVNTFAYPYGHTNGSLVGVVRNAGYSGARATRPGMNTKSSDEYTLRQETLGSNVGTGEVRRWIDEAWERKSWLILTIHHVDNIPGEYSITPSFFLDIVNYAANKRIKVVTVREGLSLMR